MKKAHLLLTCVALLAATAFKHPFYLSVTDLSYKAKEKVLQGSVKLFTNDIEGALKKAHGRTIDLIHPKDTAQTRTLMEDYLKKHLYFKVNGKAASYAVLGFEQEEEAIWTYIELRNCPLPKTLDVENSLLYDHISTQSNIVHVDVNGVKKSSKADNPEKQMHFRF